MSRRTAALHTLVGAYVMDAVPESDRAAFERHLVGCPACQEEVRGLREATARLATASAITPRPELREQTLLAATRLRQVPPLVSAPPEGPAWRPGPGGARPPPARAAERRPDGPARWRTLAGPSGLVPVRLAAAGDGRRDRLRGHIRRRGDRPWPAHQQHAAPSIRGRAARPHHRHGDRLEGRGEDDRPRPDRRNRHGRDVPPDEVTGVHGQPAAVIARFAGL